MKIRSQLFFISSRSKIHLHFQNIRRSKIGVYDKNYDLDGDRNIRDDHDDSRDVHDVRGFLHGVQNDLHVFELRLFSGFSYGKKKFFLHGV